MLATSRGWRRQFSHPEMQRPSASISGCNGSIRDVVDIFGCLRHPKMHEAIQDARSNSGCARILNCFMHLGMLEAISIRMEIVSGNFRCLSISNCGFPAPDEGGRGVHATPRDPHWRRAQRRRGHVIRVVFFSIRLWLQVQGPPLHHCLCTDKRQNRFDSRAVLAHTEREAAAEL